MIVRSRGSTLALWQAHRVCDGLGLDHKAVRVIQTAGDKDTSTALHSFGSVESSPRLLMKPCLMEKSTLRCTL